MAITGNAFVTGMDIGKSLQEALGLPRETRRIVITVGLDEAVLVSCEYYPDRDAVTRMQTVFERFGLKATRFPEEPPVQKKDED